MENMDTIAGLVGTVGFPIAITIFLLFLAYKLIIMTKEDSRLREEKLIESNNKNTETLMKIANTIEASNELNRELNDTNKSLVAKIDNINERLIEINGKVDNLICK